MINLSISNINIKIIHLIVDSTTLKGALANPSLLAYYTNNYIT